VLEASNSWFDLLDDSWPTIGVLSSAYLDGKGSKTFQSEKRDTFRKSFLWCRVGFS